MTSDITIDERGIVVRVVGEVSGEVIDELVRRMAADPRFDPSMPTVWDFSASIGLAALSAEVLRGAATVLGRVREGGGHPRVAIVTPRDADYGIARMFEGMTETRILVELGIFRDLDAAVAWAHDRAPDPPNTK
jgi:hypothetical protein